MSVSGALFDLAKLSDVSKNVISLMSADEVLNGTMQWAQKYDTDFYELLNSDMEFAKNILSIDRGTKKPRKDIAKYSEVKDYTRYFYDEIYTPSYTLPENISPKDAALILEKYMEVYDPSDDKNQWFTRIKDICQPLGYTPNVKEYKKNPSDFKGHVGDVSTVIRIAITSRVNTPDLHAIMSLLGKEKVMSRLELAKNTFEEEF